MAKQKQSAGLVMFHAQGGVVQVLLAHPGGPLWANKDAGAWSIPKGEVEAGEDLLEAARREFREEIGVEPTGPFVPLGSIRQKSGKQVHAWAFRGELDPRGVRSNTFEMEWPPRSGRRVSFPEIDRAELFELEVARSKINPAQAALLDALEAWLDESGIPRRADKKD